MLGSFQNTHQNMHEKLIEKNLLVQTTTYIFKVQQNFVVLYSQFPGCVKPMTYITITRNKDSQILVSQMQIT